MTITASISVLIRVRIRMQIIPVTDALLGACRVSVIDANGEVTAIVNTNVVNMIEMCVIHVSLTVI